VWVKWLTVETGGLRPPLARNEAAMLSAAFLPSTHGFPFPNWWPPGTPVMRVPTPFGAIPVGDASGGVCGGMVFAAADLFHAGRPVPAEPERPVFDYFCKRLLDSWHFPFGALKYYDWQRRPTASSTYWGVRLLDGTRRLTLTQEWPKVQTLLAGGRLAPLGLVKAQGLNPKQMGHHHQVLAHRFEEHGGAATLHIYDPNYPGDDGCTLTFTTDAPDSDGCVTHAREGPVVRGFFSVDHEPVLPPF
jgi:hypothetical protein